MELQDDGLTLQSRESEALGPPLLTERALTDALDAASMTVMVALDGASAMRIVDRITPDIVLLDAVMPGMDGFEFLDAFERLPVALTEGVRVAMLTSSDDEDDRRRARAHACVRDYLVKPIDTTVAASLADLLEAG